MRYMIILMIALSMVVPVVFADEDNYFSIVENFGPYELEPGDDFEIGFILSNRELLSPKEVTVSVDRCPEGWRCEDATFSYEKRGRYNESILVSVPETALPKRYTLSLKLDSEYWTQGGDSRVLVTVLSEQQAHAISYEEYLERQEQREEEELKPAPVKEIPEPDDIDDKYSKGLVEDVPVEKETAPVETEEMNESFPTENVGEAVERLESDRQFVEYLSIVLVVILVFIMAGAFAARKKE